MPELQENNGATKIPTCPKIEGVTKIYPNKTLHGLFREQSKKNPDALALQLGNNSISYGELQKQIEQTAGFLWTQGVRPGQIVAISLERSPELITYLFAIMHCGASYVPIDANYPDTRLEFIITDSGASFFVGSPLKSGFVGNATFIDTKEILGDAGDCQWDPIDVEVSVESLAYTIYTSGSTGKPKGVQVAHRNVVNLVCSMAENPGIGAGDKMVATTSISFDAMVMEIYLPLLHGASTVIIDEQTRCDGRLLLEKMIGEKVTMMWGTPGIWQILLNSGWENPLPIKALIGGEPVPKPLAHELLMRCQELWNIYGPTETTVCSFLTEITIDDNPITIGRPIANTYAYLLNENGNPVGLGEIGEIAIGGNGVSLGYCERPELTARYFISDPFQQDADQKIYLSGDLGKLLPNGEVQCLGRKDHQVKVRGHRIELGEIEAVLAEFIEIRRATVVVDNRLTGELQLIAYMQSPESDCDINVIRDRVINILPDYMIPSIFMWVDDFPLTSNGKIDKKSLPLPEYVRPHSASLFKKPGTPLEKKLANIWSELLGIPQIGIDDNFFEMGGTSLLSQKLATNLRLRHSIEVPVVKLYQFPTISQLSEYVTGAVLPKVAAKNAKPKIKRSSSDIAVIGMAGRFPGAQSVDELWEVLKSGMETTSFFTSEELDRSLPESLRNDPQYVKARGVVPSAKTFDAAFFDLTPKVAEAMDPQQRLFMEIAWEALEQAGHLPAHYKGSIGVYAGAGTNTYYRHNVLPNQELIGQVGQLQADTINEKDYIASRTAYHLNLKGPAVSVHSACSTSLLAVAEAVEGIRSGQCDVALAGGASITAPMFSGHLYQEGSMLSSDGHCRSFDAEGKGTVFSDGAGVVLLKSVEAAQRDGDNILGIIKGVGINNDGGNKGSFTAPSAEGQADAIRRALDDAQVSPATISYVEAHGTATPLGDPIEMEGLQMAFGKQDSNGYCALGSIKSNMGHLTAAAGVAGLIKTILAVNHRQIPASLGFEKPNPAIDFENSPFFVNTEFCDWESDGLRRAGVSSFGVGGTNVHIVVEEHETIPSVSKPGRPLQLLAWSAKTDKSMKGYATVLGNYFEREPATILADVAYSLNITRQSFAKRGFIVAGSNKVAKELFAKDIAKADTHDLKVSPGKTVFLFPGQGAQFIQMGRVLYEQEEVFREAVDTCATMLSEHLGLDIRLILFPDGDVTKAESRLKNTRFAQPALFVIEYAMSQLWGSWGIQPEVVCGHSIGEFVAAHLAGIFTLSDALRLIALRGELVSQLPAGGMLAVRINGDQLNELLPDTLSIAAINSERACVVSGPTEALDDFSLTLNDREIPYRGLKTSHAFHSAMMDPILDSFGKEVAKLKLNVPSLPIISTVTGTWLTDAEAVDPEYWTNHLRATVRFADAMDTILALEDPILLEVGPGRTLSALSKENKSAKGIIPLASLPIPKNGEDAYPSFIDYTGPLMASGGITRLVGFLSRSKPT